MPQTFDVPGVGQLDFPDDATPQEIQDFLDKNYNQKPKTSAAGAFGRAAATSALPSLAAAGGFWGGFELGGLAGLGTGPGALITGVIGGLAGAALTEKLQRKAIKEYAPPLEKLQQADIEQHPLATSAGGIAGALPTFELAPGETLRGAAALPKFLAGKPMLQAERRAVTATGTQLGLAAGIGVVAPYLEGEKPTVRGVAENVLQAALLGHPRIQALRPSMRLPAARQAAEDIQKGEDNASIEKAAEVHGDLRAQPVGGAGQMPVEKGVGGVFTQAQGRVAEAAQIPLNWEQEAQNVWESPVRKQWMAGMPDVGELKWNQLSPESKKTFAKNIGALGAAAPVKPPVVGGNPKTGFHIDWGGKREGGFQTVEEATMAANQLVAGARTMEAAVDIPEGVEEVEAQMAAEQEEEPSGKPPPLVAGAYKDPKTGKTTSAPFHKAAAAKQGVVAPESKKGRETKQYGFLDAEGNFHPREESEEIAEENDQLLQDPEREGQPHTDDVAAPGTDTPIGDAGMTIASVKAKILAGETLTQAEYDFGKSAHPVHKMPMDKAKFQVGPDDALLQQARKNFGVIMEKLRKKEQLTQTEQDMLDAMRGTTERTKARRAAEKATPSFPGIDAMVQSEADKLGKKAIITDKPPPGDENVPFALRIAYVNRAGRLVFNRNELDRILSNLPQSEHAAYINRLVNEEHLHSLTPPKLAEEFWRNATAAEKKLSFQEYTGFKDDEEMFRATKQRLTEAQKGAEMLRQVFQRLEKLGTREAREVTGLERIKTQAIDMLQRVIFAIRKALGTRASGIQNEILDRLQRNVDNAREGTETGALVRKREELPELLKGERLVTVVKPDGTSYVAAYADKSYDLTEMGKGKVPSIAKPVQGAWSHGALAAGEHIVEDGGAGAMGGTETAALVRGEPEDEDWLKSQISQWSEYASDVRDKIADLEEGMRTMETPGAEDEIKRLKVNEKIASLRVMRLQAQLDKLGGEQAFPAAMRRESKKEREARLARERTTESLFGLEKKPAYSEIMPLKGEKPPEAPTPEGKPTTQEALRASSPPPEDTAVDYFGESDAPKWDEFQALMAGSGVPFEEAMHMGINKLTDHLAGMPGARIEQLIHNLGLESHFFGRTAVKQGRTASTAPFKAFIDRKTPEGQRLAQQGLWSIIPDNQAVESKKLITALAERKELFGKGGLRKAIAMSKEDLKDIQKRREAGQRTRNRAISLIVNQFIRDAQKSESPVDLNRTDFTIDDIDWNSPRAVDEPFVELSEAESKNKVVLKALFTSGARRSNKDPVTHTKKLGVVVNRTTGEVEVRSGYWDPNAAGGEGDVRLFTGSVPGKAGFHATLDSLPANRRLLFVVQLGEPVKEFRKSFKTLGDFDQYVDIETAKNRAGGRNVAAEEGPLWHPEVEEAEQEETPRDVEITPPEERGETEEVTYRPPTRAEGGQMFTAPPGKFGPQGYFLRRPGEVFGRPQGPLQANEVNALYRVAEELQVRERGDLDEIIKFIHDYMQVKTGIKGRTPASLRGDYASAIRAIMKAKSVTLRDMRNAWAEDRREAFEAAKEKLKAGLKREEVFDVPEPTEKQAYAKVFDQIYDDLATSKTQEEWAARTLGRFYRPPPQPLASTAEQRAARPVREELGFKRPLIAQERGPIPTAKTPFPGGPPVRPPEPTTLPPEAAQRVQEAAARRVYPPEGATPEIQPYDPRAEYPSAEPPLRVTGGKGRVVEYPGFEFKMPKRGLLGPRRGGVGEGGVETGAFARRTRDRIEHGVNQAYRGVSAMTARGVTNDLLAATHDLAHNNAANESRRAQTDVYAPTFKLEKTKAGREEAKKIRQAAIVKVQAGFDKDFIPIFRQKVEEGLRIAEQRAQLGANWFERYQGKRWVASNKEWLNILDYAERNWDKKELDDTAWAAKNRLDLQYRIEKGAGSALRYDSAYVPGRYEAELFDDSQVAFGNIHDLLGRNWKAPKTFPNYFEAAKTDAYIPRTKDIAELTGHRVRQGLNMVNYKLWVDNLKNYIDPHTNKPIATDPIKRTDGSLAPADAESVLLYLRPGYEPLSVRKGFEPILKDLSQFSEIHEHTLGRNALELAQRLKHSLLIGDFFHLGRVTYYGMALMNPSKARLPFYGRGVSLLDYSPDALLKARDAGLVSPESYKWATEPVRINLGSGNTTTMNRMQIASMGERAGLNSGRIQDALYKHLVEKLPGVGQYNRWLFDKITRGFIAESFVHNFEKYNQSHPEMDVRRMARDVATDINRFFGNLGKQGWIKSATYQDLVRMAFLAPQWVEGLVMKEAGLATRGVGAAVGYRTRKGLPPLGALGRGMGAGLVTMIAATQALNLLFRGKPTWENEEKGHMFDAMIPIGGGEPPMAFSPLSVFNELSHDVARLGETKPKAWDVVSQIGQNKLSPYGRAAMVGARSTTPTGQYITTTRGVLGEMGRQMLPVPISLSMPLQMAGHAALPGTIPSVPRQRIARQIAAPMGLKIEPALAPAQQIMTKAEQFMRDNPELKKSSGWMEVQTDEPNYTKLRTAIRNGDDEQAKNQYDELRVSRTHAQIMKAMRLNSQRPFTGSKATEHKFLYSLSDRELDLYTQAMVQKQEEYEKFLEWVVRGVTQ